MAAKNAGKHDWAKAQPHDAVTGKIRTKNYAQKHPEKVEWVKVKSSK